jgi:putative transposase
MSELYQSLSHSRWNCKYHVVFVPKRRRHKLFGEIRRKLGPIFHELEQVRAYIRDQEAADDQGRF